MRVLLARGLLFLMILYMPGISSALDLKKMTPMNCTYESDHLDTVSGQIECGEFTTCQGRVRCLYVDNEVLANEFRGDIEAAKKASDRQRWYQDEPMVHKSKWVWSEITGKNPKFIKSSTTVHCLKRGSTCPGARECLLDNKGVTAVGSEDSKQAGTDIESTNSIGTAK